MLVLKILYVIVWVFLMLLNLGTLSLAYAIIKKAKTEPEASTSLLLGMESILFLLLVGLSFIIDENQFMFNIKATLFWAGGFFLFVYLHLFLVSWIASKTVLRK